MSVAKVRLSNTLALVIILDSPSRTSFRLQSFLRAWLVRRKQFASQNSKNVLFASPEEFHPFQFAFHKNFVYTSQKTKIMFIKKELGIFPSPQVYLNGRARSLSKSQSINMMTRTRSLCREEFWNFSKSSGL